MLEKFLNVRHANRQAHKLAQLAEKGRRQEVKRLERELRHVRAEIEIDVMTAEDDDNENRFSHQ